jgi:hypothetical protein
MSLTDKIIENVSALPESKQMQLLDFAEYLRTKAEKNERKEWADFSLATAMRGIEEEKISYSMHDLKETFA